MLNERGEVVSVMGDHEKGLALLLAVVCDDLFREVAVLLVESVEWFIEDEQFGLLDEGPCQKHKPLLPVGEVSERSLGEGIYAEDAHPVEALPTLRVGECPVESDGVGEPAGNHLYGRNISLIGAVHLGTYIAYSLLDVPDALPCSTTMAEEGDVAGVCLRIVGADERQQRTFSRTVRALDGPVLTLADGPREVTEDGL